MVSAYKYTRTKKVATAKVLAKHQHATLSSAARRRRRLVLHPVERDPFLAMMSSRKTSLRRHPIKSCSCISPDTQTKSCDAVMKASFELSSPCVPEALINIGGGVMTNMLIARRLPEKLLRPEFEESSPETLEKAGYNPEVVLRDLEIVRKEIAQKGGLLYSTLSKTNQEVPSAEFSRRLPQFITVRTPITMKTEHMPSHMLAVYPNNPEMKLRRVITLPIHAPVLAAHCCRVPPLPSPVPPSPLPVMVQVESQFHRRVIPLVPFAIPSIQTFPIVYHFLYTQDISQLFCTLVPVGPSSGGMWNGDFSRLPEVLAETFTGSSLVSGAMRVYGVWQNACSLGVLNPRIWQVIDIAWKAHREALLLCRR